MAQAREEKSDDPVFLNLLEGRYLAKKAYQKKDVKWP